MGKKFAVFCLFFTLFIIFPAIITFAQDIQQGNATWYPDNSPDLHASHARLPPGTRLRVTNLNNQKEVYVTVTDRIANSSNRILDISQEAAALLDMNETGYTPIRMVVIRGLLTEQIPDPQRPAAPPPIIEPVPAEFVYEDEPVPEITAVSMDDEEYEDYNTEEDSLTETASFETPSTPPPQIRTYDQQTQARTQPAPAVQSVSSARPETAMQSLPEGAVAQVLLTKIVVLINGREQTIDIPEGVYIPLPVTAGPPPSNAYQPSSTSAPSAYQPPAPSRTMPAAPPVQSQSIGRINIIPKLPDPYNGKVYRVQIGAFSRVALAQVCFNRLRSAGFNPAFEQNGSLYRVVISGVRAAEVSHVAQRLDAAGFTEAWIREESRR
jgi:rare lipoprotein A (peptidoglycan hydrolase)